MNNKVIIEDVLNEIDNIKKYNKEIANNVSGDTIESYVSKIEKDINELQTKIEDSYLNK